MALKGKAMAGEYDLKVSPSGKFVFNLKTGNSQVIGRSEMYSGNAAMENGIASVKQNGPDGALDDNT